LRKLQFEPVILEDEDNRSLTIIEKLERATGGIGFAFILYTPDDFGGLDGMESQPRARQNVIFEHGLLIGLLGRDRTCALVDADVEVPSDVNGMIFERVSDIRREPLRIAKVLKQAGYDVDASGLL
jgi:predicted nucleotide-binding protein